MRLIQLPTTLVFLLAMSATPCFAASANCLDILTGPLASEEKENAGKPINEVVEALLRDAETIYSEGSWIVGQKRRIGRATDGVGVRSAARSSPAACRCAGRSRS
jgi:hypothetical protein